MRYALQTGFGFAANFSFNIYNRHNHWMPKAVRSALFQVACWLLMRKFALRDFARLQQIVDEDGRNLDKSHWWGDWE